MSEGRNQKKERTEVKTFSVPFALEEIKENITINTDTNYQLSKEEIIKKAFQFDTQGNTIEAAKLYQICINQGFKDYRVFSNYGVILKNLGKLEEAELSTRKAIELNPDLAQAHSNLGVLLNDLGKLQEAELSYRKALELNPDFAMAHYNLGNVLRDLGKLQEAELSYRKALELNPDYAEVHSNLGVLLNDLGKLQEAEISTHKAIELKPNFSEAHYNLGNILRDLGNLQGAELSYLKAIELNPNFTDAHSNLGALLNDLGKEKDAMKHHNLALEKKQNNIFFFVNSKLKLSPIMNNNEQIDTEREEYKRQLEKIKDNNNIHYESTNLFNPNIFYLAYHNRLDDKVILEKFSDTISKVKGVMFKDFSIKNYLATSSKRTNLKLGICSEFLRENHTIGKLYTKVLIDLLKTDIEVSIYIPPNTIRDSGLDLIENNFKRVIYLPKSTDKASKIIFSDNLDILFYPDIGMSNYTYILALSRLALVQVTSLGHPNTTGIKNIDYFITTEKCSQRNDSFYSERLIKFSRLPFNYSIPKIEKDNTNQKNLIGLEENFKIGLTQTLFKLHPDYDKILESILMKIQSSYLIIIKDKYNYITEALKKRWEEKSNLLIERSIFLDRMSKHDFINTISKFDIMLDPFYFGSGNTFYEAMTFGTPFITYTLNQAASAVAAGYKQMRVDNPPIASSPEDYINWCSKYANDSLLLESTKKDLSDKARKYLFNDQTIYKEYYSFFNDAVKNSRIGKFLKKGWKASY